MSQNRKLSKRLHAVHRLLEQGQRHQAESSCLELYNRYPKEPEVLFAMALVRLHQGNYAVCIDMLEHCLRLNPGHHDAKRQLLACYLDAKRFEHINEHAGSFGNNAPDDVVFLQYLAYRAVCNWSAADAIEQRVIQLTLKGMVNAAVLMNFTANPNISPELNFRIHRVCGQQVEAGKRPRTSWPRTHSDRLRIAYLSADFYNHSVGKLMLSLVNGHDHHQFELFCYAHMLDDDGVTDQIRKGCEHFVDITGMSDEQAAQRIFEDEVDILIELGGHTTSSRIGVMAFRPAPVQCSYLGYPVSTGLNRIDFRISSHSAESDAGQNWYSESLLLLPDGFLCRADFPDITRRDRTPAERNRYVTFGSFNDVRKLNPATIALWCRLMRCVEGSRMIIKGRSADKAAVQQNLYKEFASHGIAAERIEFPAYAVDFDTHVRDCSRVDLALDPFPYHGTATTSETLWMGVPVMTLVGEAHVQRASYALMQQIGFEDTSAFSEDEYVERASTLVNDIDRLNEIRKQLPELMQQSSLCRPGLFVPQFEQILLQACEQNGFTLPEQATPQDEHKQDHKVVAQTVEKMIVKMPGGVRIALPVSLENRVSYVLSEQGDWYDESIRFLRGMAKKGMHVLVLNAGYGCYALSLARAVGAGGIVMAFENDSEQRTFLERSKKMNRMKQLQLMGEACTDALLAEVAWAHDIVCVHGESPLAVLDGCNKLLTESSPLVLLEAFSNKQVDARVLAYMIEIGYATYRLVPGLGLLVPFAADWIGTARQDHLFFCKPDRAEIMETGGYLVSNELDAVQLPEDSGLWINMFKGRASTRKLLPVWKQLAEVHHSNPEWVNLRNALHAYQLAGSSKQSPRERYGNLNASLSLLLNAADLEHNAPRLSSCARVAAELGRDDDAIAALTILKSLIESEQTFVPKEPFLTTHACYDHTSFNLRIADWMLAQVETQLELLQRPTAWADATHLLKLEALLQRRDFLDAEITRRAKTARRRTE